MAQSEVAPTQRAYTLRLRGAKEGDHSWRDALWATHEAVNKGAKVFGDWLLTLRGGLGHELADELVKEKGHEQRAPNDAERRDRRILLALSWLSVEDEHGAPKGDGVRVATDTAAARGESVKAALCEILKGRGVNSGEIGAWLNDCGSSLGANIRDDAVWVNRSRVFDEACQQWHSLDRVAARAVLAQFFGETGEYLSLPVAPSSEDNASVSGGSDEGVEFRNIARGWVSFNLGTGEKSDNGVIAERLSTLTQIQYDEFAGRQGHQLAAVIAKKVEADVSDDLDATLDSIRSKIGWKTGRKSKGRLAIETACRKAQLAKADLEALAIKLGEEAADKKQNAGRQVSAWVKDFQNSIENSIGFKFVNGRDLIGEYSTMLDHAARRVSIGHSWIKRAEQRRREFEQDAAKLGVLRQRALQAVEWLDQFCAERSVTSGATADGGYRIRKRALGGKHAKAWKVVVARWTADPSMSIEDRIGAVHQVQSDWDEDEKFGEEQLFKSLADAPDFVWKDASILTDYAAGTTAEHDRKRFKVPAYRHPDALRHPVFCDFGNSRWTITFACHEAAKARGGGKRVAAGDAGWIKERHGVRMFLWDGRTVVETDLHWSCKRLTTDMALNDDADANATNVTRADRLGRANSGVFGSAKISNVFDEKDWNGRLQAPRDQLDRIARLLDKGKRKQAESLSKKLHWLISFSPRLRPTGPFIEYASLHELWPAGREIALSPRNERDNWRGLAYPFWHPANEKGRKGHAKLILSRLPGLRVLSVDLGHRFAAACAVWEALPLSAFKQEIAGLKMLAGGASHDHLYLHAEKPGKNGKPRTVIYRRIGPDMLSAGKQHPAPWARLERQFLIKLQGEDRPTREASNDEIWNVHRWESEAGFVVPLIDRLVRAGWGKCNKQPVRLEALKTLGWRPRPVPVVVGGEEYRWPPSLCVNELMSETIQNVRRTLYRHGDRARIAFNLATKEKLTSGGGRHPLDRAGRVELLTRTLTLWHGLFSGKRWADSWAAEEWKKRGLPEIAAPGESEDASASARLARRNALENTLRPQAEYLVDQELTVWSAAWRERWVRDDAAWSGKGGCLRILRRWIAPRGLRLLKKDDEATRVRKKDARTSARHIGGLSVTRINTISALYQILKAFKMRPEPDDLRKNVPQKGDDKLAQFNRRLLDMRDRVREQRVKQLVSRIVEGALGVGRIKGECIAAGAARPRERKDTPCHAVVIESLTHYRPDDLRTRRENRQLMQWSSAKVQKYLKEHCQLYGLHLREVPANYTSRQCSRTGLPGVRCVDVPAGEFLVAPWWNKTVNGARKKIAEKKSVDSETHFFADLANHLQRLKESNKPLPRMVRVPRQGGDLFVPAPPRPSTHGDGKRALQADLNAAANIGLRALLDPDFPGRWWYVPCRDTDGTPAPDKVNGCVCFGSDPAQFGRLGVAPTAPANAGVNNKKSKKGRGAGSKPKEITNYWADTSSGELRPGVFRETPVYWSDVKKRAIDALRVFNGLDSMAVPW